MNQAEACEAGVRGRHPHRGPDGHRCWRTNLSPSLVKAKCPSLTKPRSSSHRTGGVGAGVLPSGDSENIRAGSSLDLDPRIRPSHHLCLQNRAGLETGSEAAAVARLLRVPPAASLRASKPGTSPRAAVEPRCAVGCTAPARGPPRTGPGEPQSAARPVRRRTGISVHRDVPQCTCTATCTTPSPSGRPSRAAHWRSDYSTLVDRPAP